MADYSTAAGCIPIPFAVGYWARRHLRRGIGYVIVALRPGISLTSLKGVSIVTLVELYWIKDYTTTARRIPILLAGGCWA